MIDDVMPLVECAARVHSYWSDCRKCEQRHGGCPQEAQRLSDLRGMRDLMATRYREYMVGEGLEEMDIVDETAWYADCWRELDQLIKEETHGG